MLKVLSDCQDCLFATFNENAEQDGCKLKILENIKNKSLKDGFYEFDQICMGFRNEEYENSKNKDVVELVLKEITPKVGYIINFTENHSLEKLKQTVDSINPSYIIVINNKPEYNQEIYKIISSKISDLKRLHLVQLIQDIKKEYYVDEAFKFCRLGTFAYCNSGTIFPSNLNEILRDFIYIKMNKLVYCDAGDYQLYNSKIFKISGGNKPKVDKNGNINKDNFVERVKKEQEENKQQQLIFSKEELYASINNNS